MLFFSATCIEWMSPGTDGLRVQLGIGINISGDGWRGKQILWERIGIRDGDKYPSPCSRTEVVEVEGYSVKVSYIWCHCHCGENVLLKLLLWYWSWICLSYVQYYFTWGYCSKSVEKISIKTVWSGWWNNSGSFVLFSVSLSTVIVIILLVFSLCCLTMN